MFKWRKLALLMFKIDDNNNDQIKQALRSYCLLVLSGHRYLKRITKQKLDKDRSNCHTATFALSSKKWLCSARFSEESLKMLK